MVEGMVLAGYDGEENEIHDGEWFYIYRIDRMRYNKHILLEGRVEDDNSILKNLLGLYQPQNQVIQLELVLELIWKVF